MSLFAVRRIAMLGNHTPRQCGIATFTADLRSALCERFPLMDCRVAAMDDPGQPCAYPACVQLEIPQEDPAAYVGAARFLNERAPDVLSVQHEYGIFGGPAGSHLTLLLRQVRMPVVTTLHTILPEPDPRQRAVMEEIIQLSERLVVMSAYGAAVLRQVHGVPERRIDLIPHGIPAVPASGGAKARLGLDGRRVLLTFGLLAPDKGIETVIDAMPAILERFPDALYVVLGASHPHILARSGESYRAMLEERARRLGVADSVAFHNRFVSLEELTGFLAAADLYLTPYLKLEQSTSGTLAYALGAGKAVISTPYTYARELLAEGRGVLVPRRDPAALAREAAGLLGDGARRLAMGRLAAERGRSMAWPVVAAQLPGELRPGLPGARGAAGAPGPGLAGPAAVSAGPVFTRHGARPILAADQWPYPVHSVFNPGAARLEDGSTLLLVRAEDHRGRSHLTAARSRDGLGGWAVDPAPTFPADPRDHPEELLGGRGSPDHLPAGAGAYAVAYTAYGRAGPGVSLALTERLPQLPAPGPGHAARQQGRRAPAPALRRPVHPAAPAGSRDGAHIWLSRSPDLCHWGEPRQVLRAHQGGCWDAGRIGLSPPPIETPRGWLVLYHGVRRTVSGCIYRVGAALLDLEDPGRCPLRGGPWLFGPETAYEMGGDVGQVVFPCGTTTGDDGDTLRLYYGAADTSVGLATGSIRGLLAWLDEHGEV